MLAPSDGAGWMAWFPEHRDFELYVDIVTGLSVSATAVTMVDLDLDVVRYRSGEVALLDEDEFALHQVQLGYPPEVVAAAERDAAFVLEAVRSGAEPFGGRVAAEWAARLGR